MFILQDGKLHIQDKGDKIVGVDIHFDKVTPVKGTSTKLGVHKELTAFEVKCKYQIREDNEYKYPRPKKKVVKESKKEVKSNATTKTKKASGKSK